MFFRRVHPKEPAFEERLETLRQAGFETARQPDGRVQVSRSGCGALVTDLPGAAPHIDRAGWLIAGGIGRLVDGGFQKFWGLGDERKAPALASQLEALHAFEEDLREALGLTSLYNTSLGTTNDVHQYDRVEGRDRGVAARPWQTKAERRSA
jgi:hypothetical protein